MNEAFVSLVEKKGIKYTFEYYYGSTGTWPGASWQSVRYGDIGQDPTYLVSTLWSDYSGTSEWTPIPGLRPPPGSSTTIIFILSQRIFYPNRQDDPIFPAQHPIKLPDYDRQSWINLSGPGTVFACLDTTLWRDPDIEMPWAPITRVPSPLPANSQTCGGMRFLLAALANSHTYAAFSDLLASALDAQSRVAGFQSLPLAREQWKVEAERLFAMSLARIQVDARNIARGVAKAYPGFQKQVRSKEFCYQTYMFNSEGWTNLNYAGLVSILVISLTAIVVAIPAGDDGKLFLDVMYKWAIKFLGWLVSAAAGPWNAFTGFLVSLPGTVRGWRIWPFSAKLLSNLLEYLKDGL